MAFRWASRVHETTTSTGTGDIALAGAASKSVTFSSVFSTGDYCYYSIVHQSASEWEVGFGKYAGSNTYTRLGVIKSSNSDALVSLSVGTKDIFVSPIQESIGDISVSFGDGSDGDLTASSGVTTLTQDTYYNNVTLTGTAQIKTNGYRLYISGILDISNCAASAIHWNGGNGQSGSNSAGGGALGVTGNIGGNTVVPTSGASASAATGNQPGALASQGGNGGSGGAGGKGGDSATNSGGASRAGSVSSGYYPIRTISHDLWANTGNTTFALITGGAPGSGGSSGGGAGGSSGGGSGAGGGAGVVFLFARVIKRGSSTPVGAISANGGSGGTAGTVGFARGAGGGGGGGGGGWVYVGWNILIGTSATNAITASGGNGGGGGNTDGTGSGGNGADGGSGGRITAFDMGMGVTRTAGPGTGSGTAGGANSTTTGGAGGTGELVGITL